jgi:hypothetical protein
MIGFVDLFIGHYRITPPRRLKTISYLPDGDLGDDPHEATSES